MEGMVLLLGLNEVGDSRAWTAVNGGGKDWTNLQMQLLQQQHQTQGIMHWQCYSAGVNATASFSPSWLNYNHFAGLTNAIAI
jgi:hypothetical protein